MRKGFGCCPGTCGELVQGYMGKDECISSYCIDLFSTATIWKNISEKPHFKTKKKKSIEAIELVFEHFGLDKSEVEKLNVNIKSNIPMGKGMASSTADIGASIMATLDYLDKYMSPEDISKLVAKIEPTDSIFHRNICIFDSIKGEVKRDLGVFENKKVLILEPALKISTVKLRNQKSYKQITKENREITRNSFKLLNHGFESYDMNLIKRACINSAIANEKVKKTPFLEELISFADSYNMDFINIAHTGSVVGMVFDSNRNIKDLIGEIRNSYIAKTYRKQYVRNIIVGGIRRGENFERIY